MASSPGGNTTVDTPTHRTGNTSSGGRTGSSIGRTRLRLRLVLAYAPNHAAERQVDIATPSPALKMRAYVLLRDDLADGLPLEIACRPTLAHPSSPFSRSRGSRRLLPRAQ